MVNTFKVYDDMKLTVMNLCGTVVTYTYRSSGKKRTYSSNKCYILQRIGEDDQKNARKSNSVHAWYTASLLFRYFFCGKNNYGQQIKVGSAGRQKD
jgi:hypothetical protein